MYAVRQPQQLHQMARLTGAFAVGVLALGLVAYGACSIATHVAIGRYAYGHVAVGDIAQGARTLMGTSPRNDFSFVSENEVRAVLLEEFPTMWKWVVNAIASIFRR